MTRLPKDIEVVIVGGGTSGLMSSILLSRLGVRNLVIERHPSTAHLPKAHILNQRTMEIFREVGVDQSIYQVGAPADAMSRTAWWTSLGGDSPLHRREIGCIDAWGGGSDRVRYERASPCRLTNLPQNQLEPILADVARGYEHATLLFEHEVVSVDDVEDSVVVEVQDRRTDQRFSTRARFVIAADGGRSIGAKVGVTMEGDRALVDMVTTHFAADLSDVLPDAGAAIYRFSNPDAPGVVHRGTLVQMGGGAWGRTNREWVVSVSQPPGQSADTTPEVAVERIRRTLGLPELQLEILRVSRWTVEGVVASRYRIGRVFMVGDAAHRHPPAGGLGLNSAVQDVHNLCWKLWYVISGQASGALLDTYESERRPVGKRNVTHALRSFFEIQGVDAALGATAESSSEERWAALGEYFADGRDAARRRLRVAEAIAVKENAYRALNMEIGYTYDAGAIVPDDLESDADLDDPVVYTASTTPGRRVPHVWLADDLPKSTIDVAEGRRFALLVGSPEGARA